ncbi:hypothetical protein ATANTOWER_008616 [Ataeniobius toweri]|uniref:Uncharacterized protein n=1 Tax=Ataeniobius toweri TaxID=208326 RepID=A0ABU7A5E0_9TELE|nr:hypothetical protein [Ataeniobius toweri]
MPGFRGHEELTHLLFGSGSMAAPAIQTGGEAVQPCTPEYPRVPLSLGVSGKSSNGRSVFAITSNINCPRLSASRGPHILLAVLVVLHFRVFGLEQCRHLRDPGLYTLERPGDVVWWLKVGGLLGPRLDHMARTL